MAKLNYTGPVHYVDIVSKSGKKLRFRTWAERYETAQPQDLLQERVFPFLVSSSVRMEGSGPEAARGMNSVGMEMSFTVEPPYELWVQMVENYEDCFAPDAKCALQIGYSGPGGPQLTERFEGLVQYPSISLAPDFVSMSFSATGTTWHMGQWDGAVAFNEPIIDALRYISDAHAAKLYYLNQENREVPLKTVPDSLSQLTRTLSEVKEGNDFEILKELIEINAGYEFYRRNDRIVIYNQKERGAVKEIPIFVFRGQMAPQHNRYPILTISNSNTQTALNPAARVARSTDVDLDSKDTVVNEVRNEDLGVAWQRQKAFSDVVGERDILSFIDALEAAESGIQQDPAFGQTSAGSAIQSFGQGVNVERAAKQLQGRDIIGEIRASKGSFRVDNAGKRYPLASNDPAGRQKAEMRKRKAHANSGVTCEWTTPGNPSLRPGMEVILQGCSNILNGRYQLQTVEHQMGAEFVTSLVGFVYGAGDETNDATEDVPYDPKVFDKATEANKKIASLEEGFGALDPFETKQPEEPES